MKLIQTGASAGLLAWVGAAALAAAIIVGREAWYARRRLRGWRDRLARQLLTEAVTMYRAIGMPKHVEMAEQMLGEV